MQVSSKRRETTPGVWKAKEGVAKIEKTAGGESVIMFNSQPFFVQDPARVKVINNRLSVSFNKVFYHYEEALKKEFAGVCKEIVIEE